MSPFYLTDEPNGTFNVSPAALRIAGVLALIFRVMLDVAFIAAGYTETQHLITSLLSLVAAGVAGYLFYIHERNSIAEQSGREHGTHVMTRITTGIYLGLIIILGSILLNLSPDATNGLPTSVFSAVMYDIASAFILFTALSFFFFYYCVTQLRRHPKTKILTRILIIGAAIVFGLEYILALTGKSSEILEFSGEAYLLIVGLLNVRKLQWVDTLTARGKRRLLGLASAGFVVITSALLSTSATDTNNALKFFLPGLPFFFEISCLLIAAYCARLTLAALMALPTAGVVDRRNSEVDSLAYLNRIVAETVDFDKLIEVVTQKARLACNASAAWMEMRSGGERITASPQGISHDQIEWLHLNPEFDTVISRCEEPCLIESLEEHPRLASLTKFENTIARSLIAIPLLSGTTRIGTLIVVKVESYGFEPDDVRLLTAFRDNVSVALENARLMHDSVQNERIKREMMVARTIQQRLLPQQIPTLEGFEIEALSHPAYEVGGDYYDIVRLRDGSLCILIGDVSGKGVPAAFYMAQLKGAVLALSREVTGARDFLSRINATLHGSIEKQIYITLLCAVLRNNPATITISRAGHMPALLKQHGGVAVVTPKGMGIGLVAPPLFDRTLEECTIELAPGDACLLFTDGVSESRSPDEDELGYEPLLDVLRSPAAQSAATILHEVNTAVVHHAKSAMQHDDITAVAVVYKGIQYQTQLLPDESVVSAPVAVVVENFLSANTPEFDNLHENHP